MLALHPPVEAPIVRPFAYAGSPFARGLHRGADLAAAPGAPVLAPCAGTVAFAGARVLTFRCGGRRVTVLPVAGVAVHRGQGVAAGERVAVVGRRAGAHRGLHLGVRRAGEPFGYEDPAPLLRRAASPPLGPAPPPARPVRRPPPAARRPRATPTVPAPAGGPWPAWLGAAAAALAAAGAPVLRPAARRRRRRAAGSQTVDIRAREA